MCFCYFALQIAHFPLQSHLSLPQFHSTKHHSEGTAVGGVASGEVKLTPYSSSVGWCYTVYSLAITAPTAGCATYIQRCGNICSMVWPTDCLHNQTLDDDVLNEDDVDANDADEWNNTMCTRINQSINRKKGQKKVVIFPLSSYYMEPTYLFHGTGLHRKLNAFSNLL